MREIEFRGKRKIDDTWIYGGYIKTHRTNKSLIGGTSRFCQIKPETLGQYTGLKDKNGTKIFEGDIVRTQEYRTRPYSTNAKKKRFLGVVEYFEYQHHNSIAIYDNGYKVKTFEDTGEYKCFDWSYFYDCEVVGNIYDNPELVNGE